ncbi:MAG: glycosyltransferase family 4 protein [Opitutaceae bacterium]|nr:glycosyltransferase family 4 protein [Opitutaceae bacterium]
MPVTSNSSIHIITHEFYPQRGGIATFTEEMAGATAGLGHAVELWAPAAKPEMAEKPWPFRLRRLCLRGTHDLTCQFQLARELVRNRRRLRYATVWLPEPGPMFTLMWLQACRAFRPHRLVLTFHGSEILKFQRNPLVRPLARRLIRHAGRVSTLTHHTRDLLLRHFPEAAGKIVLTPGALRTDFATTDQPARLDPSPLVVLTVGRLHPRKGQLQTLRALQALPAALQQRLEYWVVGAETRADYAQELQQAAAESAFPVRMLGDLTDGALDDIYDQADIFAMTSINYGASIEGFGLVYLEASAHGLPVIAHDVGGVSEAVQHEQTGLLVPPDQPAVLTAAFQRLLADAGLRMRLGQAGRTWARRNSWPESASLLFGPAVKPAISS